MTAKCANPACNVRFFYFRSGKIFVLEANGVDAGARLDSPKRKIEFFWLCGECAPTMHMMRTTDGAVFSAVMSPGLEAPTVRSQLS